MEQPVIAALTPAAPTAAAAASPVKAVKEGPQTRGEEPCKQFRG